MEIVLVTRHPQWGTNVYRLPSIDRVKEVLDDLGKDYFEEGDEADYLLPGYWRGNGEASYLSGDFDLMIEDEVIYQCHIDIPGRIPRDE
ncbi:MAG: hypothetical protein JJ896_17505 [Rhodothermales bacterium]|nr:hypothetical protein [Rhodothermales bacterium]MBO6781458.1 hypothetical protein [Rhodothermales bacterium]